MLMVLPLLKKKKKRENKKDRENWLAWFGRLHDSSVIISSCYMDV